MQMKHFSLGIPNANGNLRLCKTVLKQKTISQFNIEVSLFINLLDANTATFQKGQHP